MLCYVMSCYVMSCYDMSCHVMLCHVMLCVVLLCHVMLYYVLSNCVVLLLIVTLCYMYVLSHCVVSCYVVYVIVSTSVSLVALIKKQLIVLRVVKCLFSNIQYFSFLCFCLVKSYLCYNLSYATAVLQQNCQ